MKIPKFVIHSVNKISNLFEGGITVLGELFGIQRTRKGLITCRLQAAATVFMIGVPVGLIILGSNFSLILWLAVVTGILLVVNLNEAICLASYMMENGVEEAVQVILSKTK